MRCSKKKKKVQDKVCSDCQQFLNKIYKSFFSKSKDTSNSEVSSSATEKSTS